MKIILGCIMNYKMLKHCIKNKMLYPTYQNKDTVLNINLWIDSKTDNYMSDLCPGYCLKEKDKLTDWKLNTKNDVKLYDIFISPTMLRKSIENIAKERFTLEEALSSKIQAIPTSEE